MLLSLQFRKFEIQTISATLSNFRCAQIMKQAQISKTEQEWLKVLGKGMITIPKVWREELGIDEGEVVKAKKVGNQVIIEAAEESAPYRIFSDEEIRQWLKDDKLPKDLAVKVDRKIRALSK